MASTQIETPTAPRTRSKGYLQSMDEEIKSSILSPKFLSAAAMAGWDEEALLIATLVVEDTPVRESQLRKRRSRHLQSPLTTSSNRKRRSRRRTAEAIPSLVLCVDDNGDSSSCQEKGEKGEGALAIKKELSPLQEADLKENKSEGIVTLNEEKGAQREEGNVVGGESDLLINEDVPSHQECELKEKISKKVIPNPGEQREEGDVLGGESDLTKNEDVPSHQECELKEKISKKIILKEDDGSQGGEGSSASMVSGKGLPCMDQLREELSCAICLEICYEPSTTPCGHSFCKQCLKRAAEKCGKSCPKCRQVISYGRPCSINTVLWNTIQLLFPEEVEAGKKAAADPATSSRRGASNHGSGSEQILRHMRSRYLRVSSSRSSNNSFRSAMEVMGIEESYRNSGRRYGPSQAEDAALALRQQREEFLEAFRISNEEQRDPAYNARARLRSMASAAHRLRSRGYHA